MIALQCASLTAMDSIEIARRSYAAYAEDDREALEALVAPDFTFSSGPDPLLDREGYFERCWPNHGALAAFDLVRLVEIGDDEILVTYEAERTDGTRFRNTEVLTIRDGQFVRAEVYFGWNLS